MTKRIFSWLVFMLLAVNITAQNTPPPASKINLLANGSISVVGTSTTNSTSLNINLPAGKNRVLIVWYFLERYHNPLSGNFPASVTGTTTSSLNASYWPTTISPAINGNSNFKNIGNYASAHVDQTGGDPETNTELSNHQQSTYINIGSSTTVQNVTVNYSSINAAKSASDEMIVGYAVYDNISIASTTGSNSDLMPRSGGFGNTVSGTTVNYNLTKSTIIPVGRVANDIVYVGSIMNSLPGAALGMGNTGSNYTSVDLANTTTTMNGDGLFTNENDGLNARMYDFNRASGSILPTSAGTTVPLTVNKPAGTGNGFRVTGSTLLPFARPGYSGTVYIDNNAATIGGTTTGASAAAQYVYVIDSSGKVIYKTNVDPSTGKFTIDPGYIEETGNYTIQLSNVNVLPGDNKPATQTASGYGYTRESLTNTGIENPGNGELDITNAGITGLTDIRFGVKTCAAGTSAPTITTATLKADCTTGKINLTSASVNPPPNGSVLEFHTSSTPSAATLITDTNVGPGVYYAVFHDLNLGCYSPASAPITVGIICADDDSYTNVNGITGSTPGNILANDNFNSLTDGSATVANVNITVLAPATPAYTGAPIPSINTTTGDVTVPPGTPAGNYTITYRICSKTTSLCDDATVSVNVASTTILADDDDFSATPVTSGQATNLPTSVFANDNYNGGAEGSVNSTNATLTTVGTWPTGITINPSTGIVSVAANTAPGLHKVTYNICDKLNPGVCDPAEITILVAEYIDAVDNTYNVTAAQAITGVPNAGNVLTNDSVNNGGNGSATTSTVNVSVVTPASPAYTGAPVPTLDITTGNVSIPVGTPAGNYTITYRICEKTDNTPCDNATITVNVATTTIIADNDDFSSTIIKAGQAVTIPTSVFANDNYNGGAEGSATSANATLTVVGTWPTGITIDPITGIVSVAANTAPGTHKVTYSICDKLNPGVCDTAEITIVVELGYCYKLPTKTAGVTVPTKHGITALSRAGNATNEWPVARQSAWTVLEAKTKGFVINRVAFAADGNPVGIATANFVEGMMVYDTTNNCLKIYNGTVWNCYSIPACP